MLSYTRSVIVDGDTTDKTHMGSGSVPSDSCLSPVRSPDAWFNYTGPRTRGTQFDA